MIKGVKRKKEEDRNEKMEKVIWKTRKDRHKAQ